MDRKPVDPAVGVRTRFRVSWRVWSVGALLASTAALGCGGETAAPPPPPVPVDAARPVLDSVADTEVFTGRTQTPNSTDLKARVTGYLLTATSKEGADVKKDEILFTIEPKPYIAARAKAEAAVLQQEANIKQAQAQFTNQKAIYQRDRTAGTATAQQTIDLDIANVESADATLRAAQQNRASAEADLDTAKLFETYATIRAPFDGRISRRMVDPGNDVIADVTVLANIVQLDPLYAYFDVDERTLLRIGSRLPYGKVTPETVKNFPLKLGLASAKPEEFTHTGVLTIIDNKVDPTTGTVRMWGTFENHDEDLKPGMFVRARMDIGEPKPWLFVSEDALGSDQGRRYLYVVNKGKNKEGKDVDVIEYRHVEVGPRKDGRIGVNIVSKEDVEGPKAKKREDWDGLQEGELIVLNNLQRLHAPQEVKPTVKDVMPQSNAAATTPAVVMDKGTSLDKGTRGQGDKGP